MFRVSFLEQYKNLVYEIGKNQILSEGKDFEGGEVVIGDDHLKQKYLDTGLDGNGIAILGMKEFKPDKCSLTFHFPDYSFAHQFKIWMSNSGEQQFNNYLEADVGSYMNFNYHDPGGSDIVVSLIKD